jgi:hypothetical protein
MLVRRSTSRKHARVKRAIAKTIWSNLQEQKLTRAKTYKSKTYKSKRQRGNGHQDLRRRLRRRRRPTAVAAQVAVPSGRLERQEQREHSSSCCCSLSLLLLSPLMFQQEHKILPGTKPLGAASQRTRYTQVLQPLGAASQHTRVAQVLSPWARHHSAQKSPRYSAPGRGIFLDSKRQERVTTSKCKLDRPRRNTTRQDVKQSATKVQRQERQST